ncbi:hypothetical protein AGMMS50276_33180 [Synergistales bacterium]|nr:hypothetical protein AGMMS50276_33180 [Synergistales bacterium]
MARHSQRIQRLGGRVQSAVGGVMNNKPAPPQSNGSFDDAMMKAARSQYMSDTPNFDAAQQKNPMLAAAQGASVGQPVNRPPNYNSDPVTGLPRMPGAPMTCRCTGPGI